MVAVKRSTPARPTATSKSWQRPPNSQWGLALRCVRCNLCDRGSVPEGTSSRERGISMPVRYASVLGVCLLACSFAAQAAEKRLDRTFTVAPGGRLTIDSDGSDLRVEGTSGNQVEVHILIK